MFSLKKRNLLLAILSIEYFLVLIYSLHKSGFSIFNLMIVFFLWLWSIRCTIGIFDLNRKSIQIGMMISRMYTLSDRKTLFYIFFIGYFILIPICFVIGESKAR